MRIESYAVAHSMRKIDVEAALRALGEKLRQETEEWCDSPECRAQNARVWARVQEQCMKLKTRSANAARAIYFAHLSSRCFSDASSVSQSASAGSPSAEMLESWAADYARRAAGVGHAVDSVPAARVAYVAELARWARDMADSQGAGGWSGARIDAELARIKEMNDAHDTI